MASESTDDGTLTVSLPRELDDWLGERAQTLGVDRETVLLQLLSAYRAAAELDDDDVPLPGSEDVEEAVASVQQRLDERIDAVESTHDEDIDDVRERVVQLKREIDGKAPADHDHDAFARIDDLAAELAALESTVETVEDELASAVEEHDDAVDDLDARLDEVHDRLKTVAWVVSDLREAHKSGGGVEAVERIKRAAAKADVERAKCENCGEGVSIGLLTEPECPHCEATVTNVEPAQSFFGKPQLLTASQLESGDGE